MAGKTYSSLRRLGVFFTATAVAVGAAKLAQAAGGTYSPDWPSLQKHEAAPEWFRDAKYDAPLRTLQQGTFPRNLAQLAVDTRFM